MYDLSWLWHKCKFYWTPNQNLCQVETGLPVPQSLVCAHAKEIHTHWYVCTTVRSHWCHCQLEIIQTVMKLVMSSRTNFLRSFNMSVSHGLICRILIWDVQLCIIQIRCPTYCDILTHFQNVSFPTKEVKKRNLVSFLTTAYALVKGHLKPTHLKSSSLFAFTTKLLGQDSPSVHLFS